MIEHDQAGDGSFKHLAQDVSLPMLTYFSETIREKPEAQPLHVAYSNLQLTHTIHITRTSNGFILKLQIV